MERSFLIGLVALGVIAFMVILIAARLCGPRKPTPRPNIIYLGSADWHWPPKKDLDA